MDIWSAHASADISRFGGECLFDCDCLCRRKDHIKIVLVSEKQSNMTESQNLSVVEVGRDFWRLSGPTSLLSRAT